MDFACLGYGSKTLAQQPGEPVSHTGQFRDAAWCGDGLLVIQDGCVRYFEVQHDSGERVAEAKTTLSAADFDCAIEMADESVLLVDLQDRRFARATADNLVLIPVEEGQTQRGRLVDVCVSPDLHTIYELIRTSDGVEMSIASIDIQTGKRQHVVSKIAVAYGLTQCDQDNLAWSGMNKDGAVQGTINVRSLESVEKTISPGSTTLTYVPHAGVIIGADDQHISVFDKAALNETFSLSVSPKLNNPIRLLTKFCVSEDAKTLYFVLQHTCLPGPMITNRLFRVKNPSDGTKVEISRWDLGIDVAEDEIVGDILLTKDGSHICIISQSLNPNNREPKIRIIDCSLIKSYSGQDK